MLVEWRKEATWLPRLLDTTIHVAATECLPLAGYAVTPLQMDRVGKVRYATAHGTPHLSLCGQAL